ncbi:MAG TPA: histidine kinase [Methylibium sp.]|nr:histidine kinase [Methylibium sp.]
MPADTVGGAAPPVTGFGSTGLDGLAGLSAAPVVKVPPDVCQPGVMLRALLFVHGVLALGVGFVAVASDAWWPLFASASAVALPALLLWLSITCLASRLLERLPAAAQALAASAWGAACALLPWWGWEQLQPAAAGPLLWLHVGMTGAALAAAFWLWLRQRARLRLPAATTARLAELQSRIRPHFLFNTLNTAIALVRVDPARAEAVLEDLAELFRVALADGGSQAAATVRDEVELARRYLAIEQLRFGERLQVRWDLDAEAERAKLPPLILQPLVENAVRHGIEPSAAGGTVRVRTRVRRGQVEIAVVNTVPEQASEPGHGIALRNVRERLRLMHDVAADFRAGRDGALYRVEIVVPL